MSTYIYRDKTAIIFWLSFCLFLVFCMVALGGYTRLTGSGLSITDWRPIHGAIPPLNAEQWQEEFDAYRQIDQYQKLNKGMSLDEFKAIFWPEFLHRQLGRIIGLVFLLPLVVFSIRRSFSRSFGMRLTGIFALGGLQATVGWIMVHSGLQPGMLYVSPIKLALHLSIAFTIFALLVWALLDTVASCKLQVARQSSSFTSYKLQLATFYLFLALLTLQIIFGAFVAGSHAGLIYNTWPTMNGMWIPDDLLQNHLVLIQFIHRKLAIILSLGFVCWWFINRSYVTQKGLGKVCSWVALVIGLQFALGVWTLLDGDQGHAPLHLALSHQMTALILVGLVTLLYYRLKKI